MKYIRVTVRGVNEEPPNRRVAMYFPINGDEFARLIPMTAAPRTATPCQAYQVRFIENRLCIQLCNVPIFR